MKQISNLRQRIEPWASLKKEVTDIQELANLKDSTIKGEIIKSLEELNLKYQQLKKQLAFSGKYDGYDVIMSINARNMAGSMPKFFATSFILSIGVVIFFL